MSIGLNMELVIMDVPVGYSITRVLKTCKFEFPETINSFALHFIPLLQVAWKGKEIMKDTITLLNDKKRKAFAISGSKEASLLSPSFYHRNS
jgi:hypothetical protein